MFSEYEIDSQIQKELSIINEVNNHLKQMIDSKKWDKVKLYFDYQDIDNIPEELVSLDNNYVIYILETNVSPSISIELYKQRPQSNNQKYSRLNRLSDPTNILYVGSSKKFKTRLKQHISVNSIKSKKTYSLWLNDWFEGDVIVHYYYFNSEIKREVIQKIEDIISCIKKPLFGKKGSNGK